MHMVTRRLFALEARTHARCFPPNDPLDQGCSAAFPVLAPEGGSGQSGDGRGQSEGVALVAEVREAVSGKGAAQAYQSLAERMFQVRRDGRRMGMERGSLCARCTHLLAPLLSFCEQTLSREDGVVLQHIWLLKVRSSVAVLVLDTDAPSPFLTYCLSDKSTNTQQPRTVPKTTSGKIARKWCKVNEYIVKIATVALGWKAITRFRL